jgi:DNA-binding MarR family transcriptional regulator
MESLSDKQREYLDEIRKFKATEKPSEAMYAKLDRLWYDMTEEEVAQIEAIVKKMR